ncbi:MAG: AAA-like domain-containing protein [Pseudomonadota bacterium]
MTKKNPYCAVGAFDGVSYVERDADVKLYEAILENQHYPYCLAPHHSGKSSLMIHLMKKLDSAPFKIIFIDIQGMASLHPDCLESYDVFLKVFTAQIVSSFKNPIQEVRGHFLSRIRQSFQNIYHAPLGFDERMKNNDLETVFQYIATHWNNKIIIIIDEIEQLLDTKFKDNFFSLIRSFFSKRTTSDKSWYKIQFVLSGAAQPTELISKQHVSPFNVGAPIILRDLSLEQVTEMSKYLYDEQKKASDDVVSHIYKYTSGSVYLTQLVFEKLWKLIHTQSSLNPDIVDQVVKEIIDESQNNVHFLNIHSRMIKNPNLLQSFLTLVAGERINEQDIEELKMAGITTGERGYRNLIYERVFGINGPLSLYGEIITRLLAKEIDSPEQIRNISQRITILQKTLTNISKTTAPQHWAALQVELANSYAQKLGDHANSLEQAITCYQRALQVITCDTKPLEWAKIMNSLAIAYRSRIRGTLADNLEKAIESYEAALQVTTQEDMPVEWATTKNNLASAYSDRIRGTLADNLEKAIKGYKAALQVRTHKDMPVEWAETKNNLANAYFYRIRETRADNLEKAIESYEAALQVITQKNMPVDWATTKNNLALAYSDRIHGTRADNLEKAIESYEAALQVITQKDMPVEWAETMNSLANAYSKRICGTLADNLEKAIELYQAALQVRTQKDMPVGWAETKNNLANAYSERIRGTLADNLEKAIEGYEAALQVRTQEDMPVDWATTKNNLASAYNKRIRGT